MFPNKNSLRILQTTNANDLNGLQSRQAELVKQLEQLRVKLNEMQKKLGTSAVPVHVASTKSTTAKQIAIRPIDVYTSFENRMFVLSLYVLN